MKTASKFLIILSFVCISYLLANAQNVPPEAWKAAQIGLPEFLQGVTPRYEMLGFKEGDSLQKAILGQPFEVYSVIPKNIFKRGIKCKSIISNPNIKEFYFPVLIDNQVRTILSVYRKKDNSWAAAGMGVHGTLVKVLPLIRSRWPIEKGFNPYILEFPTIQKVYFTIPEVDENNMTEIDFNNDIDSITSQNSKNLASPRSVSLNYTKLNSIDMVLDTINKRVLRLHPNKNCPTCGN